MSKVLPKVLIVYYSKTNNTRQMASMIAEGVKSAGAECEIKRVEDIDTMNLVDFDGIIVGSPAYYGLPASAIKEMFDNSVALHGRLEGKVGAAFASSANCGGGSETTCLSILQMMLVHGMLVTGSAQGSHYGPVSVGVPDETVEKVCRNQGEVVARAVMKLQK